MNLILRVFASSLGKKYLMAASGAALFLFVVGHLAGNLQIFLGPGPINDYAAFLKSKPALVWSARLGLLALVILHIYSAVQLSIENRKARPVAYGASNPVAASYASRTMLMSGLILAAFILYHLLHFTVQAKEINFTGKDFQQLTERLPDGTTRHDVYQMMILGFRQPVVSAFYLVAMGLLCLHLSHGVIAMFQSLGLKTPARGVWIDRLASVSAWLIFIGYASIPIAVLLGVVKEVGP